MNDLYLELKGVDDSAGITQLEKIKLKIEYETLKIERYKAWGTVLSICIPLIAAVATIYYGIYLEDKRAKTSFEIKAVEIIMNAASPQAATNKAVVLYELFPDRLPKDFKEKMLLMYGKRDKKQEQ